MKMLVRVQNGALVPDHLEDREALSAYKTGQVLVADVKGARNPLQHNLFWSLMGLVGENHPTITNKDAAARACKVDLKLYDPHIDRYGEVKIILHSIACESMEQGVFNEFFKQAVEWVSGELGNAPAEILDELNRRLADKRYTEIINRMRR
jgi:hypothetical protein